MLEQSTEDDLKYAELFRTADERTLARVALVFAVRDREEFMRVYETVKNQNVIPQSTLVLNPAPSIPVVSTGGLMRKVAKLRSPDKDDSHY